MIRIYPSLSAINACAIMIQISKRAYDSLRGFCCAFTGAALSSLASLFAEKFAWISYIGILLMVLGLTVCVVRGSLCWRERIVRWWLVPAFVYFSIMIIVLILDLIRMF